MFGALLKPLFLIHYAFLPVRQLLGVSCYLARVAVVRSPRSKRLRFPQTHQDRSALSVPYQSAPTTALSLPALAACLSTRKKQHLQLKFRQSQEAPHHEARTQGRPVSYLLNHQHRCLHSCEKHCLSFLHRRLCCQQPHPKTPRLEQTESCPKYVVLL